MIKVAIFTKVMVQHFAKRWAFVIIKILKLTLNVDWETVPLTKIYHLLFHVVLTCYI